METKFQTSFIPKKPLTAPVISSHSGGVSIFMVISVILFLVSLGGAGFAYGWKGYLEKNQVQYKKDLEASRNAFNPKLIEDLKRIDTKIGEAQKLLGKHMAVSAIFDIVGQLTAESVRFTSFDFSSPTTDKEEIKLSMRGTGASFSSVAFQAKVFGQSSDYGRNKLLKNPVLSDLSVDDKGNVTFSFGATLNPATISYAKILDATLESEGTASTTETTQ